MERADAGEAILAPGLEGLEVVSPDPFEITGPASDPWYACTSPTPRPAVVWGYYVLLKPLPAGSHTLKFAGRVKDRATLDITYDLTMVE